MVYNGQEVGEPGAGVEGFGGDDARTSIFDYWSMPELVKWISGHKYDGAKLSPEQKELRVFYGRLVKLLAEPAFRDGRFFPLNHANRDNPTYGRLANEQASGHWLYSYVRYDPVAQQRFLVVVNLNPTVPAKDVQVRIPEQVLGTIGLTGTDREKRVTVTDRLNAAPLADVTLNAGYLRESGVPIAELPPLSAAYLEIKL